MSKFKVGDRVRYDGLFNGTNSGTVTRVEGATASVQWDDGICLVYGVGRLLPLGSATTFKVGDRVVCTCGQAECVGSDVVISVHDTGANVKWDASANETSWPLHRMRLVAPAPPGAVAPTLETATGAELDRIAEDRFMTLRWSGETDTALRYRCQRIRTTSGVTAPAGYELKFSDDGRYVTVTATGLPNPPPPVLTFTAALPVAPYGINRDVADYVAEHDRMRAALDTVRAWLSSHSFESTTRQCQKEAREVMARVLAALDAERAGK